MITTAARFHLFVYGTLRPGSPNYKQLCEGRVKAAFQALARGHLFHLPAGYPALVKGEAWVHGEIICFDDPQLLRELDAFEDYDPSRPRSGNLYQRTSITVYDMNKQVIGRAQTYVMNLDEVRQMHGEPIIGGEWKPRDQN